MPKPRGWSGDWGKRYFGKGRPRYEDCLRCSERFWTEGRHALYCAACRPLVKLERDREYQARRRQAAANERELDDFAAKVRESWARRDLGESIDVDELVREYGQDALVKWVRLKK